MTIMTEYYCLLQTGYIPLCGWGTAADAAEYRRRHPARLKDSKVYFYDGHDYKPAEAA